MQRAFPTPPLRHGLVVGAALLLFSHAAIAQVPAGAPSSPKAPETSASPPDTSKEDESRAQAEAYLAKGVEYIRQEQWSAALTELLEAVKLDPGALRAVRYAAFCLQKLQRYDEALDMTERLLRDHASALDEEKNTKIKKAALELLRDLKEVVGTVAVKGAEPGASIIINGRFRGTAPLDGPLRIGVGHHEIRAYKEGYDPFGAGVDIKGNEDVTVTLTSQSTGGRLRINEVRGRSLDVVVDGTVVGKTPWEGTVSVGEHVVLLRGNVNLDALSVCAPGEAAPAKGQSSPRKLTSIDIGTQPVRIPVRLRQLATLSLTAEELDTWMRIEPTPAGATVAIDSEIVGRGAWEGRLKVGNHRIEIAANGFIPQAKQIDLKSGNRRTVKVALERDPLSTLWQKPGSLVPAGVAYGAGALGLGVFAVTGIMAINEITDIRSRCHETVCPPTETDKINTAQALGTASTVGLVVGGAGLAAGTFLLFKRPGATTLPKATGHPAEGTLSVGIGLGQVRMEGTF